MFYFERVLKGYRRNCIPESKEDRIRSSEIVLSGTCETKIKSETTSPDTSPSSTCTKFKVWRVIKGQPLVNEIKNKIIVSYSLTGCQSTYFLRYAPV